jgi:hypothetical protein
MKFSPKCCVVLGKVSIREEFGVGHALSEVVQLKLNRSTSGLGSAVAEGVHS